MSALLTNALDLLVHLLQFQFEQLAPNDPLLNGFVETRIPPVNPLEIKMLQVGFLLG
jgi:hypothetical protein